MDLPLSLRKLKRTATNKDRMQWWRGDTETEKWDTKTKRNASAENAEKARSMCIIQCGVHDDGWWLVAMVMMPWGVMVAMTLAIRRGGRRPGSSASLARMQDCRWPCLYVCVCMCRWLRFRPVLQYMGKDKASALSIPALWLLWLHWFPLSHSLSRSL